jgi:hypothetical protein
MSESIFTVYDTVKPAVIYLSYKLLSSLPYATRELFIDWTGIYLLLLHDFVVRRIEEIFERKEVTVFQSVPTNFSCVIQRRDILWTLYGFRHTDTPVY